MLDNRFRAKDASMARNLISLPEEKWLDVCLPVGGQRPGLGAVRAGHPKDAANPLIAGVIGQGIL